MNMTKFYDVFNPSEMRESIHIVGCGSVGSTIAELLARHGLTKFHLWDFDLVEAKNVANQMFTEAHVGQKKTEALRDIITAVNGDAANDIVLHSEGWSGEELSGYVFLCVDNIDLRREIVKANQYNTHIVAVWDTRTGLHDGQVYAADWARCDEVKNLLRTMGFTQEEAQVDVPRSACGGELGLAITVRLVSDICVLNFMGYLKHRQVRRSTTVVADLGAENVVLTF